MGANKPNGVMEFSSVNCLKGYQLVLKISFTYISVRTKNFISLSRMIWLYSNNLVVEPWWYTDTEWQRRHCQQCNINMVDDPYRFCLVLSIDKLDKNVSNPIFANGLLCNTWEIRLLYTFGVQGKRLTELLVYVKH